jgi:hypothetical protein
VSQEETLRRENEELKRQLAVLQPAAKEAHPVDPYIESARKLLHARVKVKAGEHAGKVGEVDCASRSGDCWVHLGEHTPEWVDVTKEDGSVERVRVESHGARITHKVRHEDVEILP